ncbi:PHD domain-containing protein [Cryptosporidium canis]|uniref:PHD domain-containing protein n=1 Tax=Cryptosporidium canis TaxID=195482 RepID=A0A9D5DK99_9CRYT|nr:PHD domain-containing protein [Cryptosporidium canis]
MGSGSASHASSSSCLAGGAYRRAWCVNHNQCNNNSLGGSGGGSFVSYGSSSSSLSLSLSSSSSSGASGSQDLAQLRMLYSNIIQNNNEMLNKGEQGSEILKGSINVSYALNQNLETSLRVSLLGYYGLVLSVDQGGRGVPEEGPVSGSDFVAAAGCSRNPLFSRNTDFSPETQSRPTPPSSSSSSDLDIQYINKWEDLIQILVYEVVSRFSYGVGLPRQKTINFSKSQRRRAVAPHAQKSLPGLQPRDVPGLSAAAAGSTIYQDHLGQTSSTQNVCPACDKIYKRDWQMVCPDWIFCDLCSKWYHWYCLGLSRENIPNESEPFHCLFCLGRRKKSKRGRKRKNPLPEDTLGPTHQGFGVVELETEKKPEKDEEGMPGVEDESSVTPKELSEVLDISDVSDPSISSSSSLSASVESRSSSDSSPGGEGRGELGETRVERRRIIERV